MLLDGIVTAVISACMKKLIKIGDSLCSHFNIEDGRKHTTISALLFQLYYFNFIIFSLIISRKVKLQLKCKKRFVQCVQKVLRLIERVQSAFRSFSLEPLVLEISHWTMLCGQVDQLKLIVIKLRH